MRLFWIVFGIGTHLLFAFTVWRLVPFLQGESESIGCLSRWTGWQPGWFWFDTLLAAQFGILHSVLLLPSTRRKLATLVPSAQYGCFFCTATCLTLLLTIEGWQPSHADLWRLHGAARTAVSAGFLLSWVVLFYSMSLVGLGFQTGWSPWWAWVRGRTVPRRPFATGGIYRLLRHPVYLSLLGLVWLTPAMTLDRALLVTTWTTYVFIGSCLKDSRLLHYLGDAYRDYQARVPGYPFFFGPLGRIARFAPHPQVHNNEQVSNLVSKRGQDPSIQGS